MDFKRLGAIQDLLITGMGMSTTAAAGVAWKWHKSKSKATVASSFIRSALLHQIDQYRAETFEKFGLEAEVYPAPNAELVYVDLPYVGKIAIGYKTYNFKPCHNEEPTMLLRLRLTWGAITQILFCDSWQPLSAYLAEVEATRKLPFHSQTEYDRQCHFWRLNGKKFKFTELPGELRNKIYDSSLPAVVEPFPRHKSRRCVPVAPQFDHPCTALFKTNRQIHEEASDRFHKTTSFLVEHREIFSKVLKNESLRDRIRHLHIRMTHSELLSLFHFRPMEDNSRDFVKHQFRELDNLKSLVLHIKAPSKTAKKSWLQGACQKKAVDIIVKAAWPSIRGLPVTITGYVKDSQVKSFEGRVKSAQEAFASFKEVRAAIGKSSSLRDYDEFIERMTSDDEGGVRLNSNDSEAEATEPEWTGMSLNDLKHAMLCTCKTACTKRNWDPTT